jgi:ABC-type transporter Mla maintaining outer membrane lipid asymmetry ATPase subunit MlaF
MSATGLAPAPVEMPAEGKLVSGPSALSGGAGRFVALTRALAV